LFRSKARVERAVSVPHPGNKTCPRDDSNVRPLVPETSALSPELRRHQIGSLAPWVQAEAKAPRRTACPAHTDGGDERALRADKVFRRDSSRTFRIHCTYRPRGPHRARP